jgi:hypothetical protein
MNRYGAAAGLAFLAAALIVVALAAPSRAAESTSERRTVSGFDRIRLEGAFETEVTAAAHEASVVVAGDRDIVRRITTEVRDRTLVVDVRSGLGFFDHAPRLEIMLPTLRSFTNDGAGSANIRGLTGGDIEIENGGAAKIIVSGVAARESISLNGVGKIDTTALDARDVTVENNGVGVVHVRASGVLIMNVNGVGSIRYVGKPSHVESHVNGFGSISSSLKANRLGPIGGKV